MLSINLESRILELALSKGLLGELQPEEMDPASLLDPEALQASSLWGPRLDGLIAAGKLSQASLESLAFELIQPDDSVSLTARIDSGGAANFELPALGDRFQDLQLLGQGATGKVFKAFDTVLQRWVALKSLKVSLLGHADMILAEARAQARVEHPNVCRIYEVGEAEGQGYLVMHLVEGPALSKVFREMSMEEKIQVVRDVAEGIHTAHRQGLIHLDIKLGNILLQPGEKGGFQPLITDFGMVRSESGPDRGFCPMGTPPYSSPEQVEGIIAKVDRRSDVYSLGVVLYILLTGAYPIEADGFQSLLTAIRNRPPTPLRKRAPGLSVDLEAIIDRCLRKEPGERYASAQAMADDLENYLNGLPVLAKEASIGYLTRKWLHRHRGLAVSLLALLMLFSAGMVTHTVRINKERRRAEQEADSARKSQEFLEGMFESADPYVGHGRATTLKELLDFGILKLGTLEVQPLLRANLERTLGQMYSKLGEYQSAKPLLEKARSTLDQCPGAKELERANCYTYLSFIYRAQGQFDKAEPMLNRALEIRKELLGPDHPLVIDNLHSLASLYQLMNRVEESESVHLRVLRLRERAQGREHVDTASALNGLCQFYISQLRYSEAEPLCRMALDILGKKGMPDTVVLSDALFNLAEIECNRKHYRESEAVYKRSLKIIDKLFGKKHHLYAIGLNDLGAVKSCQGQYKDAENLYMQALEIRFGVFGPENPDVARSLNNLGDVSIHLGKLLDAKRYLMRALEMKRKFLPPKHPNIAITLYNLGCVEAMLGHKEIALQWLDEAVASDWKDATIATDSNLTSLHGDPHFEKLVAEMLKSIDQKRP